MTKITKEQLSAAEEIICREVKEPYSRQEALSQLYWQIKRLGKLWRNAGEPPITFCIRGRLDLRLSRQVSEALGLNDL